MLDQGPQSVSCFVCGVWGTNKVPFGDDIGLERTLKSPQSEKLNEDEAIAYATLLEAFLT